MAYVDADLLKQLANKKGRTQEELEQFYEGIKFHIQHTEFFASIADFSHQEKIEVKCSLSGL